MVNPCQKIANCFRQITVEPVLFSTFLGLVTYKIAETAILFQLVCYHNYSKYDSSIQCFHLKGHPEDEAIVHKKTSVWNTILTVCILGTAFFADLLLGAWGDRAGRLINMLMGFVGMEIMMVAFVVVSIMKYPLWILIIVSILCGLTGFIGIVPISCFAYLADVIPDKRRLDFRMTLMSLWTASASLIGSGIVGVLTKRIGLEGVLNIAQAFIAIGFLYAILNVRQIPPIVHKRMARLAQAMGYDYLSDEAIKAIKQGEAAELNRRFSVIEPPEALDTTPGSIPRTILTLFKEAAMTFGRRREGHLRTYLLICIPCYIIHTSCEIATHGVISLYVFHSPFNWDPSMLGYFNVSNGLSNFIGVFFTAMVLQKKLKFQCSSLILLSIASNFGRMLLLGLARSDIWLFLANAVGAFSYIMMPAIQGLAVEMVEPKEVGKAFSGFILAIESGIVFGTFLYNFIYYQTVDKFPGAVFFVICGMLTIAFCLMFWVHIHFSKQKRENQKDVEMQQTVVKPRISIAGLPLT